MPGRRSPPCSRSSRRRRLGGVDRGRATSPAAARTTSTSCSTMSGGEIRLGPAVRQADGTLRQLRRGAGQERPAPDARRTGPAAAARATSPRGALTVLKSSIPYVARVENRRAASGGVDGEDIENAKVRGPIRAAHARPGGHGRGLRAPRPRGGAGGGPGPGGRRRATAPTRAPCGCSSCRRLHRADDGRLRFEQLVPAEETLQAITDRLEEARVIGTRAIIEPPVYRGVTVVAKLQARPAHEPDAAPGRRARGAVRVLRPDHRRTRRRRLAVRPTGQRRRGLLGPPGPPRDGARRGRAAVRRRPDHRPARPADATGSRSSRTRSSSPTSTRSWSRAP